MNHLLHNEVAMHVAAAVEPWDNQSTRGHWDMDLSVNLLETIVCTIKEMFFLVEHVFLPFTKCVEMC